MHFQRSPSIVLTNLGDEQIALDASNDTFHVLNETAGWLLKISAQRISLEQAIEMIHEIYTIPSEEDFQGELTTCLLEMQSKGLITLT